MCFICNHHSKIILTNGYSRCEYCKTYIAKILPDNREVQKVLEDHAHTYVLGVQGSSDPCIDSLRLSKIKSYFKFSQYVLDFGCGSGSFVKFLQDSGYKAFGYDKSKIIQKHLSVQNIQFYKRIDEIPDSYFDVVTNFDVIEHTINPLLLIRTLKKKLKKGGFLIISTPNSLGISARILGKRWWVFGPTAHFILFSTHSIKLLLARMNFKITNISTDTLTPWFTPADSIFPKILNKLVYLAFHPFQKILFNNYLGDNIQIIVRS